MRRLLWLLGRSVFGFVEITVGAELAFEAEIRVLEEDTSVEEARAADGELVEGRPGARERRVRGGKEIGDDGRDGFVAFGFPADVAYERGEFGADTSEAGPVAWIVF
ncbi:hypothetical protein NC651_006926 [Populus alba x Populus x berolinensis]|nr:hypothetical protein NC651_006926 [Populus alba x Populus x berolinensis]